jgi:dihydrofolate reductase
MRRIISQLFVLLDGVMKAPEEWHFPYCDTWMAEVVAEQIDGAGILLLGRATYQIFVGSWPQRGDEVPLATRINAMPKLVVSTMLTSVAWQNTTVIAGDVPEELAKIKEQPGRNVIVSGSPTLVRSLLRNCLLDKLQLLVYPLVRGYGRRWLEDGLAQPLELIGVTPGARYAVTGPEALSYRDIAAQAQQDARPRDYLCGRTRRCGAGRDGYAGQVCDTVARLTGQPARSLDDLLQEVAPELKAGSIPVSLMIQGGSSSTPGTRPRSRHRNCSSGRPPNAGGRLIRRWSCWLTSGRWRPARSAARGRRPPWERRR